MLGVGPAGPVVDGAAPGDGSSVGMAAGPRPAGTGPVDDPYAAERDAWTVLSAVDGLGPIAFGALLARYHSGLAILTEASRHGARERLVDTPPVERAAGEARPRRPIPAALAAAIAEAADRGPAVLDRIRAMGVRVVTMEEAAYPTRLAAIAMPPHVLFVQGSVAVLDRRSAIALVGTRRPTSAGRILAGRLATALVAADATVVSGLAYGIDGAAHEATLRAGGATVAVIGGGHAVAVPTAHRRLADAILAADGAVVSELAPDVVPTAGTFPRRNRVISGLADATVVVEAPARSGALITASWALEQGRDCYLVPGRLDDPASAGCLAFLREFGDVANVVAGIPQLIADLGLARAARSDDDGHDGGSGRTSGVVAATLQDLGPAARQVAVVLLDGTATADEIVALTDLPIAAVLAVLGNLQRLGLAVGVHGRYRPAGSLLGERPTPRPG